MFYHPGGILKIYLFVFVLFNDGGADGFSQGVTIKYVFCLSSHNTLSLYLFNFSVGIVLFALYTGHRVLDKFSSCSYGSMNYRRGREI